MQVITDFLCEAWRTLTDSFAVKALHVFILLNYHT